MERRYLIFRFFVAGSFLLSLMSPSRATARGEGLTIESFAKQVLKEWFGAERGKGSQSEWPGVLLLVCRADRQARIEPGDDWWAKNHTRFRRIMDNQIIAEFKSGRFETGILEGVESLNHIAQRKDVLKALLPDFSRLGPKERFSLVFGLLFLLFWFLRKREPLPYDDSSGDSVD
jgi:uncharacterized membrane protein YgcG